MTSSPVVCTVFGNGSALPGSPSGCIQFVPHTMFFNSIYFFFLMIGVIVILVALYAARMYYEHEYGRFLWKRKGAIGIGFSKSQPALLGTLTEFQAFDRKYLYFNPGGKKKNHVLVMAPPGAVKQLDQKQGGVGFAFVDLDVRSTVNLEMAEWADAVLSEHGENKDVEEFAFKVKQKLLTDKLTNKKTWFPSVKDWPNQIGKVWMPSRLPTPDYPFGMMKDDKFIQTEAIETTAEQRSWYDYQSGQEEESWKKIEESTQVELRQLSAALSGKKEYLTKEGKSKLEQRDKTKLFRNVMDEIANLKGPVMDAFIGAKAVSAQSVARVMMGIPRPEYIDALAANIREQERRMRKNSLNDYMPIIIVVGSLAAIMVVAFLVVNHG